MESFLLICTYLISYLIFSITIYKITNFKFSLLTLFYGYISIFFFPGLLFEYFLPSYVLNYTYTLSESKTLALFSMSLFYIFFSLSLVICSKYLKIKLTKKKIAILPKTNYLILLSIPFILIGLYYFHTTKIYNSLLFALNGDMINAYITRTAGTNAITKHGGLLTSPFKYIFPIISLTFFSKFLIEKNKKSLIFSTIFFILSLTYSIVSIQKYQIFSLLLGFLLLYMIIFKKEFSLKWILITMIVFISTISILVAFYIQDFNISRLFIISKGMIHRIFLSTPATYIVYIDYILNFETNHLGLTFPNIGHILPYNPISYTKIISHEYTKSITGVTGSMPTFFYGEILLNFSIIGSIIFIFLFSTIIFFTHYNLYHLRLSTINNTGLYAIYAYFGSKLIEIITSSTGTIFNYITIYDPLSIIIPVLIIVSSSKIKS